ncbi:hypothetical protein ACFL3A_03560 [Pseudomonadota bacterium]
MELLMVAQVQVLALAHPAVLEVVQEALPVALLEVPPDFRNRLIGKNTVPPSPRTSCAFLFTAYEHSPSRDDFN